MGSVIVDFAQPGDEEQIQAILWSRPAPNAANFEPPKEGWFAVARDDKGISAFVTVRWDAAGNALVADCLEIEYKDGNPTVRGIRGGKALGDELERRADQIGCSVCCPVLVDNERHLKVLKRRGWRVSAYWMERAPHVEEP